jgi:hypothetical protein
MKIKTTIILLSIIFFTSCQNESIKCDGTLEKKTVISILKDEIFKQKFMIKQSLGIDENYLNKFFENNLELSLIRTTAKNNELKSCDCSAQLSLKLKQEVIEFAVNSAKGTGNNLEFAKERINNMLNMKVGIEYTIQETSDDFIVETSVPSDLGKLLGAGFFFESQYKQKTEIGKEVIYEDAKNGGGKYTFKYLENNKVKIIYNFDTYENTEIATIKNGKIITENGIDDFYELKGKYLKVKGKEGDMIYQMK